MHVSDQSQWPSFCSYEDLLMESSDDEEEAEEQRQLKKKRTTKASKESRRSRPVTDGDRGQAWIKEGDGDEPVNFLDPSVTQRVSG